MNESFKKRIDNFKKTIGFDSTMIIDDSKSVVFQNLDLTKLHSVLMLNDLAPVDSRVFIRDNGILKEQEINTGENPLYVNIFASNSGHKIALDRLINSAVFTTTMNVLYEKCPYNLGDISCSIIGNDSYHIMWTYFNVFFSVEYTGKKIDIEQFCRELQQYTETCVVINIKHYLPQFDEVIISSSTIKKGEDITVYIVPEFGMALKGKKKGRSSHLHLEKVWEANVLSLEKESDYFFRFKGIAEGTETITFILADLDALVCKKHEIAITVRK